MKPTKAGPWQGLLNVLSERLEASGFEPELGTQDSAEHSLVRWQRLQPWKKESVQVGFSTRDPHEVDVNFSISARLGDGRVILVDAAPLSAVLGRRVATRLPLLRSRARVAALHEDLADGVLRGISWFENYASPVQALNRLRSGETVRGLAKNAVLEDLCAFLEREVGAAAQASVGRLPVKGAR